jgi:predicted nuclease of predicted toxin-antitoxin system
MDHHVHAAITEGLRIRGVDCLTAEEDGSAELPDDQLLARALELDRVIFTMDVDFLDVTSQWLRIGRTFAGVVYARQLGITNGQTILDLDLMNQALDPPDIISTVERLPL